MDKIVLYICFQNVQTVQKAFEKFVHPETLDTDNAYNCTRCKQKVPAQKRFSIHRVPNVLTLQLKRHVQLALFEQLENIMNIK